MFQNRRIWTTMHKYDIRTRKMDTKPRKGEREVPGWWLYSRPKQTTRITPRGMSPGKCMPLINYLFISWLKTQHSKNQDYGIQSHHFMASRWGNNGKSERLYLGGGSKIPADGDCSHEIKRCLLLGRKVMTNLGNILKTRDITLPTKVHLVKVMVFPMVTYGCESLTIKEAEHRRIDAFELWCWRRLLRVPWAARRSNQFILKEISPEYSLEGLMLKLKL